ncbi:MAG: flagellar export protein FliJ [Proteobacteria bacterium]|nr:flagellar export protein FliJ [Pseudomonadota bacterium]
MTRSKRMEPIKQLAADREREAGAMVEVARRTLDEAERQLVQLRQYRQEYADRVARGAAPDTARLMNFHAFLGRLGDAIGQQERAVADALAALEQATDAWRAFRIEAASIGRAVEKLVTGERRTADRRLQRESDERSLQVRLREREPG